MKKMARRMLTVLAIAGSVAACTNSSTSGQSVLEQQVDRLLVRYNFEDVDVSALSTNQLTGIYLALSNYDLTRNEKILRTESVLAQGQ